MTARRAACAQAMILILVVSAACGTTRTKELLKSDYIITDILVQRIDDPKCTDKPTRADLESFAQSTKRDFAVLKKKGVALDEAIYVKATGLCERLDKKNPSPTDDELVQFVKSARDVYKKLVMENPNE